MVVTQKKVTNPRDYIDPILTTEKNLELDPEKSEEYLKILTNNVEVKVFKRRWLQLALFVFYAMANNANAFQYSIIINIMTRYYNVSDVSVIWTSSIFMVMYIFLVYPISFTLERIGLRKTILMGSLAMCLGTWIKYFSVPQDRFVGAFIGQSILAASQVVVLSVPGKIAAYWFGSKEVATATAIACFGAPIGNSICFLATTMQVQNHKDLKYIGEELSIYFFVWAIVCTVIPVALFLFFQNEPPLPPSDNRALQKITQELREESHLPVIKRLLKNWYYLLHWNAYGIQLSVLGMLSTLMNKLYLAHFEDGEREVGVMGVLACMSGTIGSAGVAYVLDRTKKFRTIAISLCFLGILAEISLATAFMFEIKWLVIISGMTLGTSLVSYLTIGIELCAEITYPESEGTSISILYISSQIYGATMILGGTKLIELYSDKAGHACMLIALIVGALLNILNRGELRRQKASRIASNYTEVPLQELKPVQN